MSRVIPLLVVCSLLAGTETSLLHFNFSLPFHAILSVLCPEITGGHLRELRCVEVT